MITLKALYNTIERFKEKNLFECNVLYMDKTDFPDLPEIKGYSITWTYDFYGKSGPGYILFLGQNIHHHEQILTHEEHVIKEIIE